MNRTAPSVENVRFDKDAPTLSLSLSRKSKIVIFRWTRAIFAPSRRCGVVIVKSQISVTKCYANCAHDGRNYARSLTIIAGTQLRYRDYEVAS